VCVCVCERERDSLMGRRNFGLRHKQPLDDRADPSKRRFILHATKMSASQDLFRCRRRRRRRRRRYALYRFPRKRFTR